MKYGFIGLGNMTTAIIKGMCNSGDFDSSYIYGYNRTKSKTTKLATSYGIQATTSIEELMAKCDVIILGVKPQMLPDVLPEVKKTSTRKSFDRIHCCGKKTSITSMVIFQSPRLLFA